MMSQPSRSGHSPLSSAAGVMSINLDNSSKQSLHNALWWIASDPKPAPTGRKLQAAKKLCKATHGGRASTSTGHDGSSLGLPFPP